MDTARGVDIQRSGSCAADLAEEFAERVAERIAREFGSKRPAMIPESPLLKRCCQLRSTSTRPTSLKSTPLCPA
jgi:hypothetical protein